MTTAVLDAAQTARVTPFAELTDALRTAALDAAAGRIASPARLVVPLNEGGVMLSMPASAPDLAIHKLVTVCPRNRGSGLPTIQGQVSVVDPTTGAPLFALDGPTVTGRRTAAVTLLAMRTFLAAAPRDVLLIGTGTQAAHHVDALAALFPGVRVRVKARTAAQAAAFCERLRTVLPTLEPLGGDALPDALDAIITSTTSATPVYDEEARAGRLVVGVGAFTPEAAEVGARTIAGSALYVDDPAGARHEAGDLIVAGVDWARVRSLADALRAPAATRASASASTASDGPASGLPVFFKSVGCAAWDLAACRVAREFISRTRACT
ncbi:delta(1)-pyrroline-2-carboxylate reductase family protein [Burkholderia thailandensis]|uniref:Ornithine cyclodeaminase/mu-crystallin family protein n=1 Tax=Burkholderia thailandensis (strain ATCC 700388 / DSM 13276 / CCUG 48851 / CIP 106301 / E264) TaxID=271848 RepID=Q2T596_BURTA|nr:delta(1)-pyrroline-2-carboxylate reductase family protein [Burkholderia thailandensis]ABC35124.1 ornithine cyclodeaminase/mu-crystallin family protein [Burkholderia thailandensis E264]AHI75744.1 ornithine cyclodeaminase/mu-crystallin family protein [Burkholderia thailandensis 2002721723]AHI81117.1 ornithine cyclodeaminase/mu-crystallin family protein [Burkholderia thailandensis E444]AIC89964.1 ornithine cyclodeaminase/mu-crystallin family protein [Burkholderia thailandensis USAMRU Malaysia \